MKVREIAPVYRKTSLRQPKKDAAYWRTRPFIERIAALEQIRSEYHHWKGDAPQRVQKVFKIIKR